MSSSAFSMPTETRSRFSGTTLLGPSTVARCSMRLSTPPSEVAGTKSRVRVATRFAAPASPATSRESIAPKPLVIWRFATAWPGVGLKSGVEHRVELPVSLEVPGDGHRVRGLALVAHVQGAHAPQEQPGLERPEHSAHQGAGELHVLPALVGGARREHSGGDVAVTGQILRAGVEDDVGSEVEGAQGHRGSGSSIDAENRSRLVGDVRRRAHVDHVPGGIDRRLDPHDCDLARVHRGLQPVRRRRIEERDLDPAPLLEPAQPVRGAVVHDPRGDHSLADPHGVEERRDPGEP